MDLKQIAEALVEACRSGQESALLEAHYHPDIVSAEASDYTGAGRETAGLEALRAKHAWWNESFEVHSATADGPYLHGDDRFSVIFEIDATEKKSGERMPMKEVAVYHVAGGKIVREEFFSPSGW